MPKKRKEDLPNVFEAFTGYKRPRYTPIPSQFLDEHMRFLSGAEVKVLLYIMRHTYGYGKDADHISAKQIADGLVAPDGRRIDWGTGLSRSSVWKAIRSLEQKGLVEVVRETAREGDYEVNYYRVREAPPDEDRGEPLSRSNPSSRSSSRPVVDSRKPSDSEHQFGVVRKSDHPVSSMNRGSPKIGLGVVRKSDTTIRDSIRESLSQQAFDFATRFLEAIGESKSSRQKRERAASIIQELLDQGFTPDEIQAAIYLGAQRGARDAALLPYIIGEAISLYQPADTTTPGPEPAARSSNQEQSPQTRPDMRERLARVRSLPREQYERLRKAALKRAGNRALPEAVIEGLMLGLLEREQQDGAPD